MTILSIILLILLGILLLLIEFAVIPGITIAGIGGFAMLVGSVYLGFSEYGTLGGFLTLLAILVSSPVIFYYVFKSRAGRKMILDTNIEGKVITFEKSKINQGDTGITLGRLAPSGKVKVNGETVEGQSTGPFIDQNKTIRVVRVLSNKIIVELINTE